ncbi:MAG: hypothetical protein E7256_01975 [Lachnospiraceae bacterium]|nr:hypothetical protein [Lachnospiraceae bacterium]
MKHSKAAHNLRVLSVIFIIFLFYLCFFQMERKEIGDVDIVRVLGIDKTDEGYHLTALYNDNSSGNDDSVVMKTVDGKGTTIYDAYQNLKRKNKRDVTIAHTSFYLLDSDAAANGLEGCLDFLSRDQTVKTNSSIFILLSTNTHDFLKKSVEDETFVQDTLTAITQKESDELRKVDNTLASVINHMDEDLHNLIIPYLVVEDENLYANGYAVFKNNKLFEYLDYETSQIIDLANGRLITCPICLSNGIGLELTSIKAQKGITRTADNKLLVNLTIDFDSDIKEVPYATEVFSSNTLSVINEMQNEYIRQYVAAIIEFSIEYGFDFLNINQIIADEHKDVWALIKDDPSAYADMISYQVQVSSEIANNYVITR